jgi:hypothetical protein
MILRLVPFPQYWGLRGIFAINVSAQPRQVNAGCAPARAGFAFAAQEPCQDGDDNTNDDDPDGHLRDKSQNDVVWTCYNVAIGDEKDKNGDRLDRFIFRLTCRA